MNVLHLIRLSSSLAVLAVLTTSVSLAAPAAAAPAQKPGAAEVPAAAALVAVPQAAFVMPAGPEEGKDPFFPKSQRPYAHPHTSGPTNVVQQITRVEVKLQGFSGPPQHPLAIINGRTFELGEEADVNTPAGKVSIRLLQFKPDGVIIQTPGERRELKLRSGI